MKIIIASDIRGYKLKEKLVKYLVKKGIEIEDLSQDPKVFKDYPFYAFEIGEKVANKEFDFGVIICRTGIGSSIACNKVKGIRCAKVDNVKEAKLTRYDNNSNVLALNGSLPTYRAKDIIDTFLKTKFSGIDRHQRRINIISNYEGVIQND